MLLIVKILVWCYYNFKLLSHILAGELFNRKNRVPEISLATTSYFVFIALIEYFYSWTLFMANGTGFLFTVVI